MSACGGSHSGSELPAFGGTTPVTTPPPSVAPSLGLQWPVSRYEAESGQFSGNAAVVGPVDQSDRSVGDLGGEASGRQAVTLSSAADSIAWQTQAQDAGANALVLRFSIPDASGGGGAPGQLSLSISDSRGNLRLNQSLQLTSRYAWLYGGVMDGTKLFDVPANASTYATASTPTHLYDEIQLKLNLKLGAGDVITMSKSASSGISPITIDFIELEQVPPPLLQPTAFLSIEDAQCGAVAADLRHTGSVFDGQDDSSYGSVFHAVLGNNPYNPASFAIIEKDYYSTDATLDTLQDTTANQSLGGLSMFQLADQNFKALTTCAEVVSTSNGRYKGVWVPAGRFYARGLLKLPNAITVQGAGMWYSKFVAVDTMAPVAATNQGRTGIASTSGNLVFSSQSGGANHVVLSNFSVFGNVTQRDIVDNVTPMAIHGEFFNSTFDNIWVEHEFIGINTNSSSNAVQISNSRARNTFADGIDFYGSTSNSMIENSSSRSTGDDGFAMWSQGTSASSVSQNNAIRKSHAELQWYGNGFSIYGGTAGSITQSTASDILNYPCLQISTQFVPASVPSSSTMSANASQLVFKRCGGNGFNQQFGALLIGTDLLGINGLTIDQVQIASPTYKSIDVRPIPAPQSHTVVASFNNVVLSNFESLAAPNCAAIAPYSGGSAQLSNVCSCNIALTQPTTCAVDNASSGTFQVISNTCSAQTCAGF